MQALRAFITNKTSRVDTVKDLLLIRDEIDQVDNEITALYQKRMELTSQVAEYKITARARKTGNIKRACLRQFFKAWYPGAV